MSAHTRIDLVLLLGTVFFVLLTVGGSRDMSRTNMEYMPDMAYSEAYESFSRNPIFPDGITLQAPPPGTVVHGRPPLEYDASAHDAERAGRELTSPIDPKDKISLQHGAEAFGVFCQPCHGPTGDGDGPVARRGFPPPPSLFSEHSMGLKDGRIFHIISFGQGNMPGYASQIPPRDRWEIVTYLRQLQARAAASSKESDPDRGIKSDREGS